MIPGATNRQTPIFQNNFADLLPRDIEMYNTEFKNIKVIHLQKTLSLFSQYSQTNKNKHIAFQSYSLNSFFNTGKKNLAMMYNMFENILGDKEKRERKT